MSKDLVVVPTIDDGANYGLDVYGGTPAAGGSLIRSRVGTTEQWAAANPVLKRGERGYDTKSGVEKIGDGVTAWSSLPIHGVAALSGTYARSNDPLRRWRSKLATDPANAKVVFVGDSTSDVATSALYLYNSLMNKHAALPGGVLYGVSADNSHIIPGGSNGLALGTWMANPAGAYPYNRNSLAASGADLIVPSWLINDMRLGGLGTTVDACYTAGRALLVTFVDWCLTNLPNADILLRMPTALLSANISSLNYVTDGVTINPAGQAQIYSTALRRIYLSMRGYAPNVDVADVQGELTGTQSTATHPLMGDQLHLSASGSSAGGIPNGGGYAALADYLAAKIGFGEGAFVGNRTLLAARTRYDVYLSSGGSAFVDLAVRGVGPAASQMPISTSDSLWIPGFDSPISLSGKTISRPFGGTSIRITGLTGLDFTSYVGRPAIVTSNNPGPTTQDRQIVSVDLPNITAGSIATTTAAVTGARTGALHDATSVVATPPAAFISAGLVLLNCYPSANDTVTLAIQNPTGGDIDRAAENWAFWVIR